MLPRNFGGVDNRYKKRALLTALLLGAFFITASINEQVEANIYHFNAETKTIPSINDNTSESGIKIKNKSNITIGNLDLSKDSFLAKGDKIAIQRYASWVSQSGGYSSAEYSLPIWLDNEQIKEILDGNKTEGTIIDQYGNTVNWDITNLNGTINGYRISDGTNSTYPKGSIIWDITLEGEQLEEEGDEVEWQSDKEQWINADASKISHPYIFIDNSSLTLTGNNNISSSTIMISNHSKLTMKEHNKINGLLIDNKYAAKDFVHETLTQTGGNYIKLEKGITTTIIEQVTNPSDKNTIDARNSTIRVTDYIDLSRNTIFKAGILKIEAKDRIGQELGTNLYIKGELNSTKIKKISAGTTNTDIINKAQMTTALNNAKPQLGKTYSAGTGINLSTNNAVGLTNAAAYTAADQKRISLVGAAKTYLKEVKTGKVSATSKDLINGSQLYSVQQSIAGFANRIQTNKNQLEALKSSINAKKTELSGIQKNLNTIKGKKLSQDMSNLTADGEAVIKNQVKKAIQKFQKDMDISTVQANVQEAKITTTANALSAKNNKPSIMLADAPIETASEPVNAVSAISKEDVAAKADLSQTKVNLEKKATLNTMDVAAYAKQLSKGLTTGESAYHAIQGAKEDRLVQAKGNTLTVGANGAETKIDASKKNWTGILVDEKEAGSLANVGYVNQTLSMESSYDKLSLMRKDLEKDTNKGIAKAAAMAALKPIGQDEEDKVSFAIGYGHYKDGNAAAIGTFYKPNQDILIHLDITAGAGKPGMNTGVSFKIGKGSSYASMTREQLAEENTAIRKQAEKQAKKIHTQKEKIEHLESVMQSIRF